MLTALEVVGWPESRLSGPMTVMVRRSCQTCLRVTSFPGVSVRANLPATVGKYEKDPSNRPVEGGEGVHGAFIRRG